jgi:hypothetical protein
MAALVEQHFGPAMDARHLPANWTSTANALEAVAFAAKDALLVIDDFNPTGTAWSVSEMHGKAERVFRAQGNHSGRQRLTCEAALRAEKPPRGIILGTGEDVPRGKSLRARILILDAEKKDVNLERLTACQKDAADGLYALSMAGFLRWLAPQYQKVRAGLREEHAALRAQALTEDGHARTPGIQADLMLGWGHFLRFAVDAGAVTEEGRREYAEMGRHAFAEACRRQPAHHTDADPVDTFLALLAGALAGGGAHVACPKGDVPESAAAWGWRWEERVTESQTSGYWRPQGRRVGWVEGLNLYLEPQTAYAEVQAFATKQGACLPVAPGTLFKALNERGMLVTIDRKRERLSIRKMLGGALQAVLHLRTTTVLDTRHGSVEETVVGDPSPT